jgi:hypothetical protein
VLFVFVLLVVFSMKQPRKNKHEKTISRNCNGCGWCSASSTYRY